MSGGIKKIGPKASLFFAAGALLTSSLFAQSAMAQNLDSGVIEASREDEVPALLEGIWHNGGRYVVFSDIPQVVLRLYYGWYNDRAAESAALTERSPRAANDATAASPAQELSVRYVPLTDELFTGTGVTQPDGDVIYAQDVPSGAWDMQVKFPGLKETYHIPIAVIGSSLYLDFTLKEEDSDSVPSYAVLNGTTVQSGNLMAGFWQGLPAANGTLISPVHNRKDLLSFYVTDSAVYHVRYWRTDMEYTSGVSAFFTDGDAVYEVPKHLICNGLTYTCVNGRSLRIRNIERGSELPGPSTRNTILVQKNGVDPEGNAVTYTVRTSTICAFGEPYLTLTDGTRTLEELVEEGNARRKPSPQSPFPPHGILDFDWSIIEDPPQSYDRRVLDLGK